MIYNSVWNLIFGSKFISIYLLKGEKRLGIWIICKPTAFDAKHRYVFVV